MAANGNTPFRLRVAGGLARLTHCYPFDKGRRRIVGLMDSILPAGDYPLIARLVGGSVHVQCDRRDTLGLRLFTFGEDEPHLYRLLKIAIAQSAGTTPVFIDAGANLGTLSIRLSRVFGCESICFEPQPALAKLLAENAGANGVADKLHIHQVALSDHEGETAFFINPDHLAESSIRQIGNAQRITVPVRRLDATISAADWKRTAIMKVDVEGFEKEVFQGATQLFETHRPPIVFEVNQPALGERQLRARDVADALRAAGYTQFHALERYLFPPQNGVYEISNILAVTNEHDALVRAYGFREDYAAVPRKFLQTAPLEI